MKNPCLGCSQKKIGCHSSCRKHKLFKMFLARKKALIKKSRIWNDYINIGISTRITNDLKEKVRKR